jgi:hypothetical protein
LQTTKRRNRAKRRSKKNTGSVRRALPTHQLLQTTWARLDSNNSSHVCVCVSIWSSQKEK